MGDVTAANLLQNTVSGSTSSVWFYVGGALLAWYLYGKISQGVSNLGSPRPRRRRGKRIPVLNAAVMAAGAGAGGYLLGKYTNV